MSEDKMMRLAHEAGMVDWFNSDKTDWLTYKSAFLRFAGLIAANRGNSSWVDIEEEEINALWQQFDVAKGWSPSVFALAVAHKLKEKNT